MKNISLLSLATVLMFSACGGGGSSSDTIPTSESITGYLADSGIEGISYTTSNGYSKKTAKNGLFNCKEGSMVTFYLGKTQLGNPVSCSSEPITPVELFNETQSSYKNNPEVINALRLLQSLDSDGIHSNGITIDEATRDKLESETISFKDLTSIENVLKTIAPDKTLVTEDDAVINFQDTLSSIKANVFIDPSKKVKFFNSYSSDYFTLQRSIVDEDTKAVEGSIKAANSAFQATVSSISNVVDSKGTIVITDAMKSSMKDLLFPMVMITLNLQPQDEATAKLLTDVTVDLILLHDLTPAKIDDAALNLTKTFIANGATLLGHTFLTEDDATILASAIGTILMTYDNVAAIASGNVVDATRTLVTNGINMTASLASTTALIINTNSFITTNGSILIAQVYLELYYRSTETNLGVINAINDNKLWNNNLPKLLDNATYDSILESIAEGYYLTENDNPWYYLSSENDHNIEEVKKIIEDFKYKFDLQYNSVQKTLESGDGVKLSGKFTIYKMDKSTYAQMPENLNVQFSAKCEATGTGGIRTIYENYNGEVLSDGSFSVDLKSYDMDLTKQKVCNDAYTFSFYIDENQDGLYNGDDRHLHTMSTNKVTNIEASVLHLKVDAQEVKGEDFSVTDNMYVGIKLAPESGGGIIYQTEYYYYASKLVDSKFSIDNYLSNVDIGNYKFFVFSSNSSYVSGSEIKNIFDDKSYISMTDKVELLSSLTKESELVAFRGSKYIGRKSPITGRLWLMSDIAGKLIQWGSDYGASFIEGNFSNSHDWDHENDSSGELRREKWSKTDGTVICPVGYRVPTLAEFRAEVAEPEKGNFYDFFQPQLKGSLSPDTITRYDAGTHGFYWTNDLNGTKSSYVAFSNDSVYVDTYNSFRASGLSVRCIKR